MDELIPSSITLLVHLFIKYKCHPKIYHCGIKYCMTLNTIFIVVPLLGPIFEVSHKIASSGSKPSYTHHYLHN